jgi:hypothetical protein
LDVTVRGQPRAFASNHKGRHVRMQVRSHCSPVDAAKR